MELVSILLELLWILRDPRSELLELLAGGPSAEVELKHIFIELSANTPSPTDLTTTMAIAAVNASLKCMASAIVVLTTTGRTAHLISKYRPRCPIIAVSRHAQTTRQAHLWRGLLPIYFTGERAGDWPQDVDGRIQAAIDFGKARNFMRTGDSVIVVTGWRKGPGSTNTMKIVTVE